VDYCVLQSLSKHILSGTKDSPELHN